VFRILLKADPLHEIDEPPIKRVGEAIAR
jgi:hypothetical protein